MGRSKQTSLPNQITFLLETEVISSAWEGLSTFFQIPPEYFSGLFLASKNKPETTNETTKISEQTFCKKKTDLTMPTGPPKRQTHLQIEVLQRIHIFL